MVKPAPLQGLSAKDPILVPSEYPSRMVGCSCESDYKEIVWFELKREGGVQKCDCGVHFRLVRHDPLDRSVRPTYGSGFGSGFNTNYF